MEGAEKSTKRYTCQRTGKEVALSHGRCLEPTDYCKWRTACPLHLLEKESARRIR